MFLRNLLLTAGVLALLAGVGITTAWLFQLPATQVMPDGLSRKAESVLVAERPLAAGTLLRREDMHWKEIASGAIAPTYLLHSQVSEAAYVGAVTRRAFAAGEPLVAAGLVKSNERGFLAAALGVGMRAVSIAVDAPQSVSGLILPGDRVDVILTQKFSDSIPAARRSVGETILRNLRVVAIDQWMTPSAEPTTNQGIAAAEPRIPKTITLEVSPIDAEKLMVAVELGTVGFSVRALEGGTTVRAETSDTPVWASDVSRAMGAPPRGPMAVSGVVPANIKVEVIRGSKAQAR